MPDQTTGPFLAERPLTGNAAKLEANPIRNFFAWPSTRDTALLTWELSVPEWINLRVERTADGGDPVVLTRLFNSEQYTDVTVPLASLTREIVYKIFVEGGDEVPVAVAVLGDTVVNPVAEIATVGQRALLRSRGMPTVWWAAKSTGTRCTCWDPIRRRILDENCQLCHGSGRRDGYGGPTLIYVMTETVEQRNVSVQAGGELEQSGRTLWTNADVRLRPRDVLILPDSKRYRVDSVNQFTSIGTRTRQVCRCLEINPSDVEFDLQVPADILAQLQRQPNRAFLS